MSLVVPREYNRFLRRIGMAKDLAFGIFGKVNNDWDAVLKATVDRITCDDGVSVDYHKIRLLDFHQLTKINSDSNFASWSGEVGVFVSHQLFCADSIAFIFPKQDSGYSLIKVHFGSEAGRCMYLSEDGTERTWEGYKCTLPVAIRFQEVAEQLLDASVEMEMQDAELTADRILDAIKGGGDD